MKFRISRLGVILTILVISGVQRQAFGQSSVYDYGYMRIAQYGDSAEINIVQPDNPNRLESSRPFPLPEGWIFSPRFRSIVSPDGQWITSILFAVDHSRLMIHLLNVDTWQSEQIIEGYLTHNGHNMAWSPDARYLAVNIRQIDQQDIDLFIYDVENGSLVDLSSDTADQRDIGWSSDSQYVLTFSHPCSPSESCADRLALYPVKNASRQSVIELSELPFLGTSACNPKLSPDMQMVSLISNCGVGVPFSSDFPNEVYIWTLETERLTRVTDYARGQMGFLAKYQHEWLDHQTLLIGVNYRIGDNQEQQQLTTFQPDSSISETLSADIGAGFVLDKETGQIALQSRQFLTNQADSGEQIQLTLGTLSFEEAIDTARLETGTAPIVVPSACEISWSPDGSLSAITVSDRDCILYMEGLTFVNPVTQTSTQYTVENIQPDSEMYYVPLGWIAQKMS